MRKIFFVYILIFTFNSFLFSNNYKLISRQGSVSVIVNKEDAKTDIKNALPNDYFKIETKDSSYAVINNDEKSILIMPKSKFTVVSDNYILEAGSIYVKTSHNDEIEFKLAGENGGYNIKGKSFTLISYDSKILLLAYENSIKFFPQKSLGLSYYLEPYHKTYVIPNLTSPVSIIENEKTLIKNAERELNNAIASHLNEGISRYSFKIFENTESEVTVYRVVHPKPGKNIFLIVPHGNERVGTDVAIERMNMPIKNGSLTIVPIGVAETYKKNLRAIDGQDINNRFIVRDKDNTVTDKLATKYMKMLKDYKIDVVLTLHEGNGVKEFFGDSIIYDSRKLDDIAIKVLDNINRRIEPYKYKFKQMYYPMPTTITYYAMTLGIDAFGIELTRNLDYDKKRIIMHTILDEFFIVYGLQ